MKNYFAYTTLAAIAAVSLMARPSFAQQSLSITVESQEGTPAVPAPVPPAPPAQVRVGGQASVSYGGDENFFYSLGGYDVLAGMNDVSQFERQIDETNAKINALKASIDAARKAGDASKAAIQERELSRMERTRDTYVKMLDQSKRMAPLSKLVDVKFAQATVKQAAEALSKASGIDIRADNSIPDTVRLTVEARKIKLSTVLESIARQSNLVLDPIGIEGKGNIGVLITQPPILRVNDNVIQTPRVLSPWSDKWGTAPGHRFIFSSPSTFGVFNGAQSAEAIGRYSRDLKNFVVPQVATALSSLNGETVMRINGGTTIKVNKDGTVTMIEPGKNDKGEDGYWTTTYTTKNGELVLDKKIWSKAK